MKKVKLRGGNSEGKHTLLLRGRTTACACVGLMAKSCVGLMAKMVLPSVVCQLPKTENTDLQLSPGGCHEHIKYSLTGQAAISPEKERVIGLLAFKIVRK